MENPNEFSYVSAPTSPSRFNIENNMYFYSVPNSPLGGVSASLGCETEPPSPRIYEDANSTFDEFEFETSRRFSAKDIVVETRQNYEDPGDQKQQQQVRRGDSLPSPMAFADELFCDGKVLPLISPLKLPPRLQNVNNKSCNQSPTASSPRSPSSFLRRSFSRRSLWNDGFDPFMVALENVKKEKRGKTQGDNQRRSRSLSPFRTTRPEGSDGAVGSNREKEKQSGANSTKLTESNNAGQISPSTKKLAEPRGLSFARRVRLVKLDHEGSTKPKVTPPSGPTMEAGEDAGESGKACIRESKSQKLKKFLFRSASMREVRNRDKLGGQNAASWTTFLRKFSFKSAASAQYNSDKRVAKVAKMTLIQYRPRLLLCLGYGASSRN